MNIDEFTVAFQFVQYFFELNVNNTEFTEKLVNCLTQNETDFNLLQSQVISSKIKKTKFDNTDAHIERVMFGTQLSHLENFSVCLK